MSVQGVIFPLSCDHKSISSITNRKRTYRLDKNEQPVCPSTIPSHANVNMADESFRQTTSDTEVRVCAYAKALLDVSLQMRIANSYARANRAPNIFSQPIIVNSREVTNLSLRRRCEDVRMSIHTKMLSLPVTVRSSCQTL